MSVIHIRDEAELEEKLTEAGSKLVVIDFFAVWCGPCKHISPVLQELAASESDVVFLKVDVDECEGIAESYGISSMPTFVFIKNKERVEELTGANSYKLKQLVNSLKEPIVAEAEDEQNENEDEEAAAEDDADNEENGDCEEEPPAPDDENEETED